MTDPLRRPPAGAPVGDLVAELPAAGIGDVDGSALTRVALLLRRLALPGGAAGGGPAARHRRAAPRCWPARATGRPVTMRGAGTSIAGNAVGPGSSCDTSRHLNRVLSVDAEARTAVVQPGAVHAALQRPRAG